MNPFERANFHLIKFCKSKQQRVYALKGPWGAGKSYLVRQFLKARKNDLPQCISYVSVFGLRTIQEVQERINGCIEYSNDMMKLLGKLGRIVTTTASNVTESIPHATIKMPDFSNSAFWYIAKRFGVLIILDDLERAPDLKMSQLLGLVSSITENSEARVLLIFNDEELIGENKTEYSMLREKVLDGEFAFRPSIRELVSEYLDEEALTNTVVQCLETKGGPNIRRILRIKNGIIDFRETMKNANILFDENDLCQVAKLIWIYDVAPTPLNADDRANLSLWRMFNSWENKADEAAENITAQLARKVRMVPNTFDSLVNKYLADGFYSEEELGEFAVEDRKQRDRNKLEVHVAEIVALFTNNFLATEDEIVQATRSMLEQSYAKLELNQILKLTWLLRSFGHASEAQTWITTHLDAVLPILDAAACKNYLYVLEEREQANRIKQRLAELCPEPSPQELIAQIVNSGSWNPSDILKLNALEDVFYHQWFRTADGDLLGTLSRFYKFLASAGTDIPRSHLHQKFENVLRSMASESKHYESRVRYTFDLEPAVSNDCKQESHQ